MAPVSTATALLFTATATALHTTATALDITAFGGAALTIQIACQSVPERGGEQWIEQIAGAMSAAKAAVESRAFARRHAIGTLRRVSVQGVRRAKAALSSGCKSHPANAPAGSNRSSYGGNEMAEAFG